MGGNALWDRKKPSFGFISTRFAGLDGVSLETQKWADVMRTKGSRVYYMAGELDTDPSVSHTAPKAHFKHEEIVRLQEALFKEKVRTPALTTRIWEIKEELKAEISKFQAKFDFDILVV